MRVRVQMRVRGSPWNTGENGELQQTTACTILPKSRCGLVDSWEDGVRERCDGVSADDMTHPNQ